MAGPWNAGMGLQTWQTSSNYLVPQFPLVQYTSFSTASTSDSTAYTSVSVVASSAGYRVVLLGAILNAVSNSSISAIFQSHTTTTQNTGSFTGAATSNLTFPYCPTGIFTTVKSEALDVQTAGGSGATGVTGLVTFIYI